MTLTVIGAGVGRTGTNSLRLALNQLGLGPCHHMYEVSQDLPHHLPFWVANARGDHDWPSSYAGYRSAVDWPTASYYRELALAYPQAKFILTTRDPETWASSFETTIRTVISSRSDMPEDRRPFAEMVAATIRLAGIDETLDRPALISAFNAHNQAVRDTIPAARLLEFQVSQGWEPLCAFLGVPVPTEPFPRTNDREEFHSHDRSIRTE